MAANRIHPYRGAMYSAGELARMAKVNRDTFRKWLKTMTVDEAMQRRPMTPREAGACNRKANGHKYEQAPEVLKTCKSKKDMEAMEGLCLDREKLLRSAW